MSIRKAFANDYAGSFDRAKSNSIRETIARRPALDATRQDLIVKSDNEKQVKEFLYKKGIDLKQNLRRAIYLARNTGQSYLILQSVKKMDSPPDQYVTGISVVSSITVNKVDDVVVSYSVGEYDDIHKDRVFMFYGDESKDDRFVPSWQSVTEHIDLYNEVLTDGGRTIKASSIPVIQTPELNQSIQDGTTDNAQLKEKVSGINKDLRNGAMMMLDADDTFTFAGRQIAGIAELCQELKACIAGATLPELILFDKSPQGISGSRKEQLENYYNVVNQIREEMCTPVINALIIAKLGSLEGTEWEYPHLSTPSDLEVEQAKLQSEQVKSAKIDNIMKMTDLLGLMPEQRMTLIKNEGLVPEDFEVVDEFSGMDVSDPETTIPEVV